VRRHSRNVKREAAKDVNRLIDAALRMMSDDPPLADKYVLKALRLCERHRVRRPLLLRRLFCRRCKRPIFPGRTSRSRVRRGGGAHVSITCFLCGSVMRVPLGQDGLKDRGRRDEGPKQ
jgi:ribonuclease P protein subunit RPR2